MTSTSLSSVLLIRIDSLDETLFRGLPGSDAHLVQVQGAPATGQTTPAAQFVLEGTRQLEATQQDDCRVYMTLFEWNSST